MRDFFFSKPKHTLKLMCIMRARVQHLYEERVHYILNNNSPRSQPLRCPAFFVSFRGSLAGKHHRERQINSRRAQYSYAMHMCGNRFSGVVFGHVPRVYGYVACVRWRWRWRGLVFSSNESRTLNLRLIQSLHADDAIKWPCAFVFPSCFGKRMWSDLLYACGSFLCVALDTTIGWTNGEFPEC